MLRYIGMDLRQRGSECAQTAALIGNLPRLNGAFIDLLEDGTVTTSLPETTMWAMPLSGHADW